MKSEGEPLLWVGALVGHPVCWRAARVTGGATVIWGMPLCAGLGGAGRRGAKMEGVPRAATLLDFPETPARAAGREDGDGWDGGTSVAVRRAISGDGDGGGEEMALMQGSAAPPQST